MLIFSKLVVGPCTPPTTDTTCTDSVVGGNIQQIFPQFTCQNTELNVMDVSILSWPAATSLSSVFIIIPSLVRLLLELKLTFSILLSSVGDNLLGVLIISQDSWLSLGNYQEMSSTGSRCAQIAYFSLTQVFRIFIILCLPLRCPAFLYRFTSQKRLLGSK